MTAVSLALAWLVGCSTPEPEVPATPPAPAADAPPAEIVCPAGTTVRGGGKAEHAALWHQPVMVSLAGDPWAPPDVGVVDRPLVREMGDKDRVWTCVREDGRRHGPYLALLDDGEGRVEGGFVEGAADGPWVGLWKLPAAPASSEPSTTPAPDPAPGATPAPEAAPAPAAPADPAPAGGAAPEASPATEASPETEAGAGAQDGVPAAPAVPDGTRLMFRGSYANGVPIGAWSQGCEPGCAVDSQIVGRYDDAGKAMGAWVWTGDQRSAQVMFSAGLPSGRFVHTWGDSKLVGSYANGERKGKWVTTKAGQVIEEIDHGGQVRTSVGKKRGGGRPR